MGLAALLHTCHIKKNFQQIWSFQMIQKKKTHNNNPQNNLQGVLHPKWSVWCPLACAGRAGKSGQSTSRQAELQLPLMPVLPQGRLLKTGPVQSDVLLPVPVTLHLPVGVFALQMVIFFLQCHPGLWVLHAGTPEPAVPWVTFVSPATLLSHGRRHGILPRLVQDQLSLSHYRGSPLPAVLSLREALNPTVSFLLLISVRSIEIHQRFQQV